MQDAAGRVRRYDEGGVSRSLNWDAAGRLVSASITRPDTRDGAPMGATTTTNLVNRYDHQGWRTRADSATTSTITTPTGTTTSTATSQARTFIWGQGEVIEEADDGGGSRLYERAGGVVSAVGGERVAHDARGSAVARAADGAPTAQTKWDAWGQPRSGEPMAADPGIGYAGMAWDPDLSLGYAEARWYAPKLGRFLSEDPLGPDAGRLAGVTDLNPYGYARGNPGRYRDPRGEAATEVGFLLGVAWGFGQMVGSMINDVATGGYHSTGDYLSVWGQNIIAGTELGLSVDLMAVSGGTAAAGSGALGFAGWDALTFDGHAKPWKEFGKRQLIEGGKGALIGLGAWAAVEFVAAPAFAWLAKTPAGKAAIDKAAQFASGAWAKVAGSSAAKSVGEFASKAGEAWADKVSSRFADSAAEKMAQQFAKRENFATEWAARQMERKAAGALCEGGICRDINCFVAGTLVATDAGKKPIESIAVGDRVLSRDEETGEVSFKPVLFTKVTPDKALVEVATEREDGKRDKLRTTPTHPFWVEGQGWTAAADLRAGDQLSSPQGGWLKVTANTWLQEKAAVYNFTVDETHTYFVGETEAWVHNTCPGARAPEGPTAPPAPGAESGAAGEAAQEAVEAWKSSLPTKATPGNSARDAFEIKHTGQTNYLVSGGGEKVWTDGISVEARELLEAKRIGDPAKSPFAGRLGNRKLDFLRKKVDDEFRRYGAVLNDPAVPVSRLRVILNREEARPYFEGLLQKYNIAGEVVVRGE